MRQFATILFVLIFAIAGSSYSQEYSQKQIDCNPVLIISGNSAGQNQVFFQNDYFDVQDTNDLDGFDPVFVLPFRHPYIQYSEIENVPNVISQLLLLQFGELLLDLPPPVLSV